MFFWWKLLLVNCAMTPTPCLPLPSLHRAWRVFHLVMELPKEWANQTVHKKLHFFNKASSLSLCLFCFLQPATVSISDRKMWFKITYSFISLPPLLFKHVQWQDCQDTKMKSRHFILSDSVYFLSNHSKSFIMLYDLIWSFLDSDSDTGDAK